MASGHHNTPPPIGFDTKENAFKAIKESFDRSSKCCRELRELLADESKICLPASSESLWEPHNTNAFIIRFVGQDVSANVVCPTKAPRSSATPRPFAEISLARDRPFDTHPESDQALASTDHFEVHLAHEGAAHRPRLGYTTGGARPFDSSKTIAAELRRIASILSYEG